MTNHSPSKTALKMSAIVGVCFLVFSLVFIHPFERWIINWLFWALLYWYIFYRGSRSVLKHEMNFNWHEWICYAFGIVLSIFIPVFRLIVYIIHRVSKAEKGKPFINNYFHKRVVRLWRIIILLFTIVLLTENL